MGRSAFGFEQMMGSGSPSRRLAMAGAGEAPVGAGGGADAPPKPMTRNTGRKSQRKGTRVTSRK